MINLTELLLTKNVKFVPKFVERKEPVFEAYVDMGSHSFLGDVVIREISRFNGEVTGCQVIVRLDSAVLEFFPPEAQHPCFEKEITFRAVEEILGEKLIDGYFLDSIV